MDGSGNYGTGKNGKRRRELMAVLMTRYQNLVSVISHQEAAWPEEELSERAISILEALSDLMRRKELTGTVGSLEICGILSHEEAEHFLGTGQQTIKEAKCLLQSPSTPLLYPSSYQPYEYIFKEVVPLEFLERSQAEPVHLVHYHAGVAQ